MTEPALFHVQFGAVQPSRGDSLHKVAAYNAAAKIGGFDFRRKAAEHVGGEFLLPPDAPSWTSDPAALWSAAEAAETRRDGQPARLVEFAIPREVPPDRRLEFARSVVAPWAAEGAAAQVDVHCPVAADGAGQPHAHVILSRRALTAAGFADRKLSNTPWTADRGRAMRAEVAARMNRWLADNGYSSRVDHRSHRERGDDTPPERNVSRRAVEIWKKAPDVADEFPQVLAERPRRRALRAARAELAAAEAEIADLRETHDRLVPGTRPTRRARRRPEPDPAWRPPTGGAVTAVAVDRGTLRIGLAGGGAVVDRGNHIVIAGRADPAVAAAVLADQARRHGWQSVEVTGSAAWRDEIAAALVARGVTVENHMPSPAAIETARRQWTAQQAAEARARFLAPAPANDAAPTPSAPTKSRSGVAAAGGDTFNDSAESRRARTTPSDRRARALAWIAETERQALADYSAGRLDGDGLTARRLPRAAVTAGDRATTQAAARGDLEAAVTAAQRWKEERNRRARALRRRAAPAAAPQAPLPAPAPRYEYKPSWASGARRKQDNKNQRRS